MTDLHWMAAAIGVTALFWLPYVLNRMAQKGIIGAMGNPSESDPAPSGWALRSKAAHTNAIENLVLFAPLVLAAHQLGVSSGTTLLLAKVFFFARLAHYIVYVLGIPVVRTLTFAAGWAATLGVAAVVFGLGG